MATQPPYRVLESLVAPKHYVPPSVRELRAQAVQRLQAGLFGMAAIVLVVGLANIINDRARLTDAAGKPAAAAPASASSANNDPLADIGAVPSAQPDSVPTTTAAPPPGAGAPR